MYIGISIEFRGHGAAAEVEKKILAAGYRKGGIDPTGDTSFLGQHTYLYAHNGLEVAFTPYLDSDYFVIIVRTHFKSESTVEKAYQKALAAADEIFHFLQTDSEIDPEEFRQRLASRDRDAIYRRGIERSDELKRTGDPTDLD